MKLTSAVLVQADKPGGSQCVTLKCHARLLVQWAPAEPAGQSAVPGDLQ